MAGLLFIGLSAAGLVQPPTLSLSGTNRADGRASLLSTSSSHALVLRGGAGPSMGLGAAYAASLAARPILTKSMTSAAIFGLSDVAAQTIGGKFDDAKRTLTSVLVGLMYFGPALHYWLEMITKLIPGFGVKDTLCKTLMGQALFGPTITCVFFAATLIANSGLAKGLSQLPQKIRQDLLVTWSSGLCFWPFVDLICYSFVPVKWIPLSYNIASFFWTIFLSIQASRAVSA